MKLMKIYYSTNILKMNQLKTNIMIIPKRNNKKEWKKETFQVDGNQLKTNETIKILGNIMNPQLNNEAEINNLIKNIEYRTTMIRKIKNFTTMITRMKMANAVIIGKLNYMMPTYTNLTEMQRQKLHVVLMKAAKATIGLPCYRWSNQRILETIGWIPLKEMIEKAKLKVLHNILITKQPTMLYNQLKIPERRTKAITVRYNIRKEKLKKFFLTTTIETYNKLPVLMKNLDQRRFKKAITKKFNKEFITTTKAKKKK